MNLLEPEMGFINREIDVTDTVQAIMTAMEELETPVEIVSHCVGPAIIQYQVRPSSRRGPGLESASRRIKVGFFGGLFVGRASSGWSVTVEGMGGMVL